MATQVPYTGVPSVAPEDRPIPFRQEETPLAAFGGLTAAATSHLGQVEDTAGNEIFQRAVAMQQLNQQAEANQATADYQGKLVQSYLDYTKNMGKSAVDALPGYVQSTEDLRQDVGSNLSSDFARKLYDGQTRSERWRTIMSASIHAKDQNRQYVLGASTARVDSAASAALSSPADDASFSAGLATTKSEIHQQAVLNGWAPEKESDELAKATSKLWSNRIQGLAKNQPFLAQKLLNQATQDGSIQGTDLASVADFVNKQKWGIGSRNIASTTMAGADLKFGAGVIPIEKASMAIGGYETHNNYAAIGPETESMGHGLGKHQVMSVNLAPWLREAGMQPMTESEFLQNPAAQEQLFKFKFGQYMQEGGSFNAAASKWFTGSYNPNPNVTDATSTTKGHTPGQYLIGTNAILARNSSLSDLVTAGRARAQEMSPDDPILGDYVEQKIEALHNQQERIQKDDEFNNRQTIEGALVSGNQSGQLPTTVEDLKAMDPKIEAAWNALLPSDQRKYMKILAANAKGDTAWTDDKLRTYQQLKGQALNDPAGFLDQDVISADLPISARKELINLQGQIKKQAGADPRTTHALQVMAPTLQAAGLTRQDKDGFNQYTGALHDAIQQFQNDNKRPPKDDEILTIGSRLLQKQSSKWWGIFPSQTEFFRMDVPSDAAKIISQDPAWARMGITPSDEDIRRVWVRAQYQKLYGGKPSTQPKVPQSQ